MATISLRCTDEDKEKIIEAAERKGLDMSKYILQVCRNSFLTLSKERSEIPPNIICNIHSLVNKFEAKEINKKTFLKSIRKELDKWHD